MLVDFVLLFFSNYKQAKESILEGQVVFKWLCLSVTESQGFQPIPGRL